MWRWAVVPAAFLALTVYGAAGPAQAQPQGTGTSPGDHGTAAQGNAEPKTSDGATTFQKPNHWQAQADPDGTANDGVDQPGGSGGTIGEQDGNNGSGNDPDCEDDNRGVGVPGHCKDKSVQAQGEATPGLAGPTPETATETGPAPTVAPQLAQPSAMPAQVLGTSAVRPRGAPNLDAPGGQVAGISADVAPALAPAAGLPNTGAPGPLVPLAAAGGLLLAGGTGLMLRRRSRAGG